MRVAGEAAPIVLNARAAGRPTVTGVERWAREVIPRLTALAPDRYLTLAPPPRVRSRALGQAWEQLVLPARAVRVAASLVFSPANLAPLAWPRNVVVLHDAAVLRDPSGYSAAYRLWHARVGIACARRALRVITVSEFSRQELIELAGLDPARITVIPGGVDARFRPDADAERVRAHYGLSGRYVLTVATDGARKNLASLEPAAARLAREGVELVWAGGSRPHIASGAAVGLHGLGYVEEGDLPGLYAGAIAFAFPSRYEGFGLPCLEAMACGTAVVASDRAALPEVCGSAALLVDPGDEAGLTEAIMRVVDDAALREELRRAGLARAAARSWEASTAAVDEVLRAVAAR